MLATGIFKESYFKKFFILLLCPAEFYFYAFIFHLILFILMHHFTILLYFLQLCNIYLDLSDFFKFICSF